MLASRPRQLDRLRVLDQLFDTSRFSLLRISLHIVSIRAALVLHMPQHLAPLQLLYESVLHFRRKRLPFSHCHGASHNSGSSTCTANARTLHDPRRLVQYLFHRDRAREQPLNQVRRDLKDHHEFVESDELVVEVISQKRLLVLFSREDQLHRRFVQALLLLVSELVVEECVLRVDLSVLRDVVALDGEEHIKDVARRQAPVAVSVETPEEQSQFLRRSGVRAQHHEGREQIGGSHLTLRTAVEFLVQGAQIGQL